MSTSGYIPYEYTLVSVWMIWRHIQKGLRSLKTSFVLPTDKYSFLYIYMELDIFVTKFQEFTSIRTYSRYIFTLIICQSTRSVQICIGYYLHRRYNIGIFLSMVVGFGHFHIHGSCQSRIFVWFPYETTQV